MTGPPPGFGVFILTHGRPHDVATLDALRKCGYTGPWWLVCDDEDKTLPEYQAVHGPDRVLVFSKDDTAQDMGDNGGPRGVVVYARNTTDRFAADLGLTHYVQLDDDYLWFRHRWDDGHILRHQSVKNLDGVFTALLQFLEDTGALTVCMAQGGDHIGGRAGTVWRNRVRRKAMNSFIVRTGRPVRFLGRMNDDVNTPVVWGAQGELFFTIVDMQLEQPPTQLKAGGVTDAYLAMGTYWKSFYTVMFAPSCVKVAVMGAYNPRIHHQVNWRHAVPMIVSDRYRRDQ